MRENKIKMYKDQKMPVLYNFCKGIRQKYTNLYNEGTNFVMIIPDISKFLQVHVSVNQALKITNCKLDKQKREFNNF